MVLIGVILFNTADYLKHKYVVTMKHRSNLFLVISFVLIILHCIKFLKCTASYSGRKITESLGNVTVRRGKRCIEQGGSAIVKTEHV
jgi:hypothetical protein